MGSFYTGQHQGHYEKVFNVNQTCATTSCQMSLLMILKYVLTNVQYVFICFINPDKAASRAPGILSNIKWGKAI